MLTLQLTTSMKVNRVNLSPPNDDNLNLYRQTTFSVPKRTGTDSLGIVGHDDPVYLIGEATKRPSKSRDLYRLLRTLKRSDPWMKEPKHHPTQMEMIEEWIRLTNSLLSFVKQRVVNSERNHHEDDRRINRVYHRTTPMSPMVFDYEMIFTPMPPRVTRSKEVPDPAFAKATDIAFYPM